MANTIDYDNEDLIDFLSGGSLDPDFSIRSKQRELNSDWRKEKPRTVDVISEYREYKNFEQTPLNKYVKIGTELLSSKVDTDAKDLQNALKHSYGLSDSLSSEVVKNMINNNKNVESRTKSFDDGRVKLRRKSN